MPRLRIRLLLLLFLPALLVACAGHVSEPVTTKADIEALIAANLRVGDPSKRVEAFLVENFGSFGFYATLRRYKHIIRDPNPNRRDGFHSILIHIYMDDAGRMVRSDVLDIYTSL